MRKIFEFKAFDVVSNHENQEFLKKVKTQNPDLYSRFVSLIGNKGLVVAMDKYNEYDPEWIKNQYKVKKKEKRKEDKEQKNEDILKKLKPEITMVNSILKTSALKNDVLDFIQNDEVISNYFKFCGIKKQYKNLFLKDLKKPVQLFSKIDKRYNFRILMIDKLDFVDTPMGDWTISGAFYGDEENSSRRYLEINQSIKFTNNELTFTIIPSFPEDYNEEDLIKKDREREREFIVDRNKYINVELKRYGINKKELFNMLKEFSYTLSDDYYDEWIMKRDANKYNL